MKYLIERADGRMEITDDYMDADYAIVPISEYNGFQKAVRIVRDRALQQIDKAKADEHGYTLLKAERRKFDRESGEAWLISKKTPYSAKINLNDAFEIIKRDLLDFYGYDESSYFHMGFRTYLRPVDYIKASLDYDRGSENEYLGENSEMGEVLRKIFDKKKGNVSFMVKGLSVNHSAGVYEVTYWSTGVL